jgi:hypothetical protein
MSKKSDAKYVWTYASEKRRGTWTCPFCHKEINRFDDDAQCGASARTLKKADGYAPCWDVSDRRGKERAA